MSGPVHLGDSVADVLESLPDAMVIVDEDGEIVLVNAHTERLFGYHRDELLGERVEILMPERFAARHSHHRASYSVDPHMRALGAVPELFCRRKDGSEFPAHIALTPLEVPDRMLVSAAIREVVENEREASHFTAVVGSSQHAIIGKDLDGVITSWNAGAERLYGYTAAEVVGRSIAILAVPGHYDELPDILRRVRAGEQVEDLETIRRRKDGRIVEVALTVSPIAHADGEIIGVSLIARDISAQLRAQQQLEFLAEHDALTGVGNRRRFELDLAAQVARAQRYGEEAGLLLIDINNFKRINDTLGHRAGDKALRTIADALRQRLRKTDTVARVGGDEFAVLLPRAEGTQSAVVAAELRQVISDCAIASSEHPRVGISASIGVAQIDRNTTSAEDVYGASDAAMYADKAARHPWTRIALRASRGLPAQPETVVTGIAPQRARRVAGGSSGEGERRGLGPGRMRRLWQRAISVRRNTR